ncbi:MAG: M67 family metallopeptidase [Candidatus Omnitrophica bacterium]|nr:M67 family metallopeptidase [Candidatus Omnitrophota bacterium]
MDTSCLHSIVVAPSFLERMHEHARNAAPQECCGVLGGRGSVVTSVYPLTNDLHSCSEYFANPQEFFNAVRSMREKNEEMIGIYHSHPTGPAEPSKMDAERNFYPGLFYLIISLADEATRSLCYVMESDKTFHSVPIV